MELNQPADLYNPLAMPPKLKKAHQILDKAVDRCYTTKSFKNTSIKKKA